MAIAKTNIITAVQSQTVIIVDVNYSLKIFTEEPGV